MSHDDFAVEHIQPQVAGGGDTLNNLAFCCQGCNNRKFTAMTALDPATGDDVRLFHPRRQTWTEHFAWTGDFAQVSGLTAVGRATIEKLQLNRPHLVNLRRALRQVGAHPPSSETQIP
ncbi:MAG: HNH endonuclease [Armatimonadota bacterium]|nr:HNH endonuclease [Armatimonadota bacterium]